jgi:phytol kinase
VTQGLPILAGNPWLGIAAALSGFLLLFAGLVLISRSGALHGEGTRKVFHAGSGVLTLAFPFLFRETWPVLLLTGASAALIAAVKFVPPLRARFGGVANRVDRTTLGELYFPVSVALLFWLTRGEHPLLFVIPILMLTFADATCALVGRRYGLTPYHGASKSLEGSVAFVVVAFFCVHVPLLLWTDVGRIESLLTASTLALLVMILEGSAWRGLDNLFIPIGGYFLLRAYLVMDETALLGRLLITIGLVALVVFARHRTTLEDDSLAAGAFLCYVAWAVMGWTWLVGPLAMLVGYRWLSPKTPDNSRRMHDVPAILSVWAPAVLWLAMAGGTGDRTLLFPYTVGFAAHLAIFGVSRLAFQFPEVPLAHILVRAVLTSSLLILVPYAAVSGLTARTVILASAGLVAISLGAALFMLVQRSIRNLPQDAARWTLQAAAAGFATIMAWVFAITIDRVLS